MFFAPVNRRNRLENAKFPVITLLIRELLGGEWFASDCVIQQAVYLSKYLSQDKCKRPRFAALLGMKADRR
jgi:hypothetical protein